MKRTLELATVGFWLVMVGLLVRRQMAPVASSIAALPTSPVSAQDEWFGIYREGHKLGHAHRMSSRNGDGYAFDEESAFQMAMLGVPQALRTSLHTETDSSYRLTRFRFDLASPATSFSAKGETDERALHVSYEIAGQGARALDLPLKEPIFLPSTLRPRILAAKDPVGTTYTLPVFDPVTMQSAPMTVTIESREPFRGPDGEVEAVRLAEEHHGVRAHAWIAPDGTVLREEAALGFTLEREPRERAIAGTSSGEPVDLALSSRIPLAGSIDDPRQARSLILMVHGPAAARIPNDPPRQRVDAGVLRITREDLPGARPLVQTGAPPLDATVQANLAPEPFIESDDPEIAATARNIVADEPDATTAARKLVRWVNANLKKEPSVTIPSAREVLTSRRGDCNEHAVLLTALARAAGIPARMVAGAMYVGADALPSGSGFYYHAWTEFWLGRWITADAVFDQFPADVTHVKLADGTPQHMMDLAGMIGNLAFATEEARR